MFGSCGADGCTYNRNGPSCASREGNMYNDRQFHVVVDIGVTSCVERLGRTH